MNKVLESKIIEAIGIIISNSDGRVTYNVSENDTKPFLNKGNTIRTTTISIEISREI